MSCDVRGVLCEWNVLTLTKNWEDTDPLSYHELAVNPVDGSILVSGSDNTIKCFKDADLLWKVQKKMEPISIAVSSDGTVLYVGTANGTLAIISCSESENAQASGISVHNGKVSAVRLSSDYKFLFSVGSEGIIFCWKTGEEVDEPPGAFKNVFMVSQNSLQRQDAIVRELRMSLQHLKTVSEYESQMSGIKHDYYLKKLSQEHDAVVDALNDKITAIKEEMQILTFDSEPPQDVQDLETAKRREMVQCTVKLNESYDQSRRYEEETETMITNYESMLRSLEEERAKISTDDIDNKTEIMAKIKALEDSIMIEKNRNREIEKAGEVYKSSIQSGIHGESYDWTDSQKELLEKERLKVIKLEEEVRKVKLKVSFQKELTEKKRQILSGGLDYDINEMKQGITVLIKDVQNLGDVLETKKKVAQTQEAKFFNARNVVKEVQQCHSVANTKVEELQKIMRSKEQELDTCVKAIKEINLSIPVIEEEIRTEKDLCAIVTEKLSEAMIGFRKKQKHLRDCEDVIKKYMSLLPLCTNEECDPVQLRKDIAKVFEQSKIGSAVDEHLDPSLENEFEHQLHKLQSCYEEIKSEPRKAMIESATAEFRLSQENSKLLHEVHDVQKEVEKWAGILSEMKMLGLSAKQQARASKQMEELRHKIEFVIEGTKRDGRLREIAKLDELIKEQQKEIQRFQTMLVAKEKAAAGKAGKKLKELMRDM
ncbi:cilia- and flagella-associated protein 57-like [Uloborus diversus]|uniref:cilia- and flagella-associated protein 57-like n=1 Tax=Uloborus diversus TaxID=327109 RepID=UPI00240A5021|nr:cilia- and flagella-associated protein 57-like [Uloborus diversus]